MRLETQRLILRDIKKSDKKDLIKNINNFEVSKWLLVVPHPYKSKDADYWINKCIKSTKQKIKDSYNFVIENKFDKKLIGGIGITNINESQGTGEIGYWLGTNYHRRGFMFEALNKVIEFAFDKLKLRRIDISAFAHNTASNGLIVKTGFTQEGIRRKAKKSAASGEIHDEIIYGLLKEEWDEIKRLNYKFGEKN